MSEPTLTARRARVAPGYVFFPLALFCLTPAASAPLALGLGIAYGLALPNPWRTKCSAAAKRLLQLSVIGLGFGMGIDQVWRAGSEGLVYTVVGISATMAAGAVLGSLLRIPRRTSALISFGTAICGGSAIAAMAPVVEAEERDIAVSLATVFTLNAVALFLFPLVGHALGLSERQFGFWAALAIHDTSSVVGASSVYGAGALALATTVKLARAAWIAPISLTVGWLRRSRSKAPVPWFILGFVAAAAVHTLVPSGQILWSGLFTGARQLLVLTLFLIGATLDRTVLRQVGPAPLLQGILLWALVGSATLAAVMTGVIG